MIIIMTPPLLLTPISEANKVYQFQFQISGIFLFTGVHKLYRPIHVTIFGQFTAAFHFLTP